MKGINAITTANDPGQDGFTGPNFVFAKDLAAFSLEYFNNDYKAINNASPFTFVDTISSHPTLNSNQLFNGNIRYMQTRLTNPTTLADMPMLNAYKYDQLNRLKESRSYETGLTSNVWNPTTYGDSYYNSFTYDAMGNIENQIRHSRNGTLIDNLTYHYQKSGGKLVRNRLYHLNDAQTNATAFTDDIDNMLTFRSDVNRLNVNNNYNYDEEGRLVKDSSERINKIVWRVDGKVKEIQRNGGSAKWLRFDYDAMGNRIAKHVFANNGSTHEKSTYYVLDAQGNQISTYDYEVVGGSAKFHLKERNIFGSSRIGSKQDSLNILTATLTQNYTQVLGNKYYEFSNHLGNVLTVFSDVKIALDQNSDNQVDGFRVPIQNIADYSPFGVQLDGRTISMDSYRYGFQNQEKDDEIKGAGNSVNYTFRMHDPRVGRFFAVDPLAIEFPWNSGYVFCENVTINHIELEGLQKVVYYWKYDNQSKSLIAIKNAKGKQIYSYYKDNNPEQTTITGVFYDNKYKEYKGDVKNAVLGLTHLGKKVKNIQFDDTTPLYESWLKFSQTTHGKDFIQTMKNVGTVIGMVVTGGSLGIATKAGKIEGIIDLAIGMDDLTTNKNGETLAESIMSDQGKIFYSSLKLAFAGYKKTEAVKNLNTDKLKMKDFAEYLNANYSIVDGSLNLKEKVESKNNKNDNK